MFFYGLNLDYAKGFKNREAKDKNDANGCNVFDYNGKQALGFKSVAAFLGLGDEGLGLQNVTDENAGDEGYDGHQNVVADEVEEIKEAQTDDLDTAQNTAVGKCRGDTQQQAKCDN